ncbi:helix-turn-helix transcriptional regulator [Aestuariibaculum sediminum]|uniref:HTH luxR-type domain-containing protein n=1 Tax=Aestuariibaculum sediminum TaxID=2770637 RepID=A0A8J6QFW5_9FLAO|nr:hypothetical protein [Aestuariibaculum sediminum]MBD0831414.1 hypothetical protein [Aestuariibaculum sediminum]
MICFTLMACYTNRVDHDASISKMHLTTILSSNPSNDSNNQKNSVSHNHIITFLIVTLCLLSIIQGIFIHLNKKALKRNKALNINRLNYLEIEKKNASLNSKNEEITKLLKSNERILFSKILQLSIYNDKINNIADKVSQLIASEKTISPNKLLSIEKALKTLINEEEIWNDFKIQFEKGRPNFFKKLKKAAPDLSVNELKHCTYVLANMRTKEVSKLINVSPRSVETARYRIKKKLNLAKDYKLFDFLQQL